VSRVLEGWVVEREMAHLERTLRRTQQGNLPRSAYERIAPGLADTPIRTSSRLSISFLPNLVREGVD
jgi:hypothetical protein